jgi:hypothetical protein
MTVPEVPFVGTAVAMSEETQYFLALVPEADRPAGETLKFAYCNCNEKHQGRTGVDKGCGQWGNIDRPPEDE